MPILYADLSEVFGKTPLNKSSNGKNYTHRNSSVGWNYNAEWNNNTQPQSEQYQNSNTNSTTNRNVVQTRQHQHRQRKQEASNELDGYYNNYEHFENENENSKKEKEKDENIEEFKIKCDDIIKHCSTCTECKNNLILKYNLTNQAMLSNVSTNYKDLAILIALGVFIIITLDKIRNSKIK